MAAKLSFYLGTAKETTQKMKINTKHICFITKRSYCDFCCSSVTGNGAEAVITTGSSSMAPDVSTGVCRCHV